MSPPSITVVRAGPGMTVQDRGRAGHMHDGVPPGGPLVPELFKAANDSLGNASDSAALEIPFGAAFRADAEMSVSLDGITHRLAARAELTIEPGSEAVHYLAIPGGIDVPQVLSGRGTLLVAGFGGVQGRELRSGDVLRAKSEHSSIKDVVAPPRQPDRPIRVVVGPDPFREDILQRLFESSFHVGATDRVGMRLLGTPLGTANADSPGAMPMLRGAIQLTGDGLPIVLGPDHPTTGGYRVIAVVCTDDLGELARRRTGAAVRFAPSEVRAAARAGA